MRCRLFTAPQKLNYFLPAVWTSDGEVIVLGPLSDTEGNDVPPNVRHQSVLRPCEVLKVALILGVKYASRETETNSAVATTVTVES